MRFIATSIRWFCLLLALAVVFFNLRLYWPSPLSSDRSSLAPNLIAQLAASREAFAGDMPEKMQDLFPEGYYFCYAFYGLTWVEAAMRDESLTAEAVEEIRWALDKLESPAGKEAFSADLPPDHGMFYSAWKSHLRAGLVTIQQGSDGAELDRLQNECEAIVASISQSESPFLESYVGYVWPCDTIPAIHALASYDRIVGEPVYDSFIRDWVRDAKANVDPDTGLLPHMAMLDDGRPRQGSRATSQVIFLRMLPDIDEDFAREQYIAFRAQFQQPLLCLPALREYPAGTSGQGDVDSGPLIFGRCLSATVMMIGVAQVYGDHATADAIARTGEVVGLPWTSEGKKYYCGGVLPVGDIMVSYSQNAIRWQNRSGHQPATLESPPWYWRWPVHLISIATISLGCYVLRKRPDRPWDRQVHFDRHSKTVDQR